EIQDSREARNGIVQGGRASVQYLKRIFLDPNLVQLKEDVIEAFGEIRCARCVEPLIHLLREHDGFWSQQHLEPDWWSLDYESELTKTRRRSYGEVYKSVIALGKIGDGRAIEAIQLTRSRWEAINFENKQIVDACDNALKLLRKNK